MSDFLQHNAAITERTGVPSWLYREDQYWARARPAELWHEHARQPHGDVAVTPAHGGSKMRMLDLVAFAGVRGVATTGVTQSNQVRQIAARLAELRMEVPFDVMTIPDGSDEVDPDAERDRGNLLLARRLYPHTNVRALPRRDAAHEAELARWIAEQQRPDHLWLPRGLACAEGWRAAEAIGADIGVSINAGTLPARTLVVLVSGSGTTHVGVARGLYREGARRQVLGLCVNGYAWDHVARLRLMDALVPLTVCDEFSRSTTGPDALARAAERWAPLIGDDVDHQWCARLCTFLDGFDQARRVYLDWGGSRGRIHHRELRRTADALVLLITGVEQRA